MPTNWIVRPHHEDIADFYLHFTCKAHPSSGCGFPCDKHGNIIGDAYRTKEQRQAEAQDLLCDPAYEAPYVMDCSHTYFNPGSLRCNCGREHHLARGDSTCECGQDYNACGQQLIARELWEERYEED